jgi:serine/threonine protein kinase
MQTHTPRAKDEISHTPRAKDEISGACSSASQRSGQTSQEESAARLKRRRACLELGQRKEDFELLELLGQGSYARVYKARSRHSTRQVRSTTVYQTLLLHSSTHRMFLSYAPTQVCCL